MTTEQELKVTSTTDEDRAIGTITVAFGSDPVVRWLFPDASQYLKYWPPFVKAFAGDSLANGTADSIDDCRGVAMWLPPGVGPDEEAVGEITAEAIPATDQPDVFALLGQMEEFHPSQPHWYLPLIGVDVTRHSRGYGTALLRHALERCDQAQLPAYLEATSPMNRSLYGRHGFKEIGVIQAGGSPPLWPMLRNP